MALGDNRNTAYCNALFAYNQRVKCIGDRCDNRNRKTFSYKNHKGRSKPLFALPFACIGNCAEIMNFIMRTHPLHLSWHIRLRWLKETNAVAERDECDSWRSRMQWPEETNAIAEGVECDGRRRQIRRQKESKASHNFRYSIAALSALYIFWFLHQTTTFAAWGRKMKGCISFESYIKPQRWSDGSFKLPVVYLLNPTSNHNTMVGFAAVMALYIFWILHQTTT